MAKPEVRSVYDLPRNDIPACRRFWLARDIGPEEWRVMLRLQDNPQRLIDAAKAWARKSPAHPANRKR
jgi:hypothetical protein